MEFNCKRCKHRLSHACEFQFGGNDLHTLAASLRLRYPGYQVRYAAVIPPAGLAALVFCVHMGVIAIKRAARAI